MLKKGPFVVEFFVTIGSFDYIARAYVIFHFL
jgi:hypothetical protein